MLFTITMTFPLPVSPPCPLDNAGSSHALPYPDHTCLLPPQSSHVPHLLSPSCAGCLPLSRVWQSLCVHMPLSWRRCVAGEATWASRRWSACRLEQRMSVHLVSSRNWSDGQWFLLREGKWLELDSLQTSIINNTCLRLLLLRKFYLK